MKVQQTGILAIAISAFSASAFASAITWNAPGNITGDSDVITTGTLVTAVNIGSGGNTTVNTVPFANGATTGLSGTGLTSNGSAFLGPGLSPSYAALVDSGIYTFPASNITLTFNGLVTGQEYEVQVWMNDAVGGAGRTEDVYDGIANTATLLDKVPATGIGQFVVGSFIADASNSQVVIFQNGNVVDQVNAYQLRSVPEPASLVLFGLGAIGLLFAARRGRMA